MKRVKLLVVAAVFFAIMLSSTWAAGGMRLGLEFGNPNAVAIIRVNPFDFKIGYNFMSLANGGDDIFFHISGDYRIVQMPLIDFLNIYLCAGLYAQIYTAGEGDFRFGARIPVGLNVFLLKNVVELFVEVVPTVRFLPDINWDGFQGYLGFTIAVPKF